MNKIAADYLRTFTPRYNYPTCFLGHVCAEIEYWTIPIYTLDVDSPHYDREDFDMSLIWSHIGRAMWKSKRSR